MDEIVLSMRNIRKEFPGVVALDDVDLTLHKGEVLSLLGENGAGKSTLLKILAGAYHKDSGVVEIEGKEVNFKTPKQAIDCGIAVIYQELNDISDLTVAENIYLERQPVTGSLKKVNWKKMNCDAEALFAQMGVVLDPRKTMRELSVAEKQIVEIARAISQDVKILVTDEPTSALNDCEVQKLFEIIGRIKQRGGAIIFISHRMDEVMKISDRIMVMRDGKNAGDFRCCDTDESTLVNCMVGRKLMDLFPKRNYCAGEPILQVRNVTAHGVHDVSFELRAGEILGVCGLMGSGIERLGYLLFGTQEIQSGEIRLDGKPIRIKKPLDAVGKGISFVPSERKVEGLVLDMNMVENISIANLFKDKGVRLNHRKEHTVAEDWKEKLRVKTPSVVSPVKNLSGGNQQKVVLSKWLQANPRILILAEPTRGIDVGAKSEIYAFMDDFVSKGGAILLITSETREVIELSDRIVVMHDGEVCGELRHDELTEQKLLYMAMGGNPEC